LGRANEEGQPLFYASIADRPGPEGRSNILACVWESKIEAGDLLAVGEWAATKTLPVYPFGFQAPEMSTMVRANQPWIHASLPEDAMALINEWESRVFTRIVKTGDERQYRISVALTKYALELRAELGDADRVSGIVYPAVATRLNSDNICLRPEAVDTGLVLCGVWLLRVKNMRLFEEGDWRPEVDAVGAAEVTFCDSSRQCDGSGDIKWPKHWVIGSTFTSVGPSI
jgi:hypothetical protein